MDIEVKMGEFEVGESPDNLVARGVGSCVVVSLYDHFRKIGGLAHTMVSDVAELVNKMLIKMETLGVEPARPAGGRERLEAKLAGGANVFGVFPEAASTGNKNILAAREKLKTEGITIAAESVGGLHGCSLEFSTQSGQLTIRTIL